MRISGLFENGQCVRERETAEQVCSTVRYLALCSPQTIRTYLYCPCKPLRMKTLPPRTIGLHPFITHQLYKDPRAGKGAEGSPGGSGGSSTSWGPASVSGVRRERRAWATSISSCASSRCFCFQYDKSARSRSIHSRATRRECA